MPCDFPLIVAQHAHRMRDLAELLIPIVAIAGFWTMIVLVVAIPVIAHHRSKRRLAELRAGLKQAMIERGYSPAEILAVLREDWETLPVKNPTRATPSTPSLKP